MTFKWVFGQHPDLLISLLNSLLPLGDDQQIKSVTYLPTELVPRAAGMKNTIVDVLCKDVEGKVETMAKSQEIARNLLMMGLTEEQVAKATGITIEDVKALKG